MDLIQVAGKYPPPPGDSEILGVEGNSKLPVYINNLTTPPLVSGVITSMGSLAKEKSDFREGDKVMALVGGGGYAGMCVLR